MAKLCHEPSRFKISCIYKKLEAIPFSKFWIEGIFEGLFHKDLKKKPLFAPPKSHFGKTLLSYYFRSVWKNVGLAKQFANFSRRKIGHIKRQTKKINWRQRI